MTLGQRIQELRKRHNLSQEGLGEKLGVSRQAISRWEMDGAVPEVDKLIAMGRLFGVSLNDLLQVEDYALPKGDAPASGREVGRWHRLLAALTAACVALACLSGVLWMENRRLTGQLTAVVSGEERVYTDRPLFKRTECTISDLELGFQQAHGTQTLEVTVLVEPVDALKGWELLGLTATIKGHDPWARPGEERDWTDSRAIEMKRTGLFSGTYEGTLTLPEYGGENITIGASFREKATGLTADMARLYHVSSQKGQGGRHIIEAVHVREGSRMSTVPVTLELALPDPRFS